MTAQNPTTATAEDGTALVFKPCEGNQKCCDCWIEWFEPKSCRRGSFPCNSQDRTDGLVGVWQEAA